MSVRRIALVGGAVALLLAGGATVPVHAARTPPPPPYNLVAASTSLAEGGSGVSVDVIRSGSTKKAVTVAIQVVPNVETSNGDVAASADGSTFFPRLVSIPAGQTTASFDVHAVDDTDVEDDETFYLQIGTFGRKGTTWLSILSQLITIPANDTPPDPVTFTLAPGDSADFTNTELGGCNPLAGRIESGGVEDATPFMYKPDGCEETSVGADPSAVTNNGSDPIELRINLRDDALCTDGGITYRSDSTSDTDPIVNHARVTPVSSSDLTEVYDVDIADAGGSCAYFDDLSIPAQGGGNLHVTVTIDRAQPPD